MRLWVMQFLSLCGFFMLSLLLPSFLCLVLMRWFIFGQAAKINQGLFKISYHHRTRKLWLTQETKQLSIKWMNQIDMPSVGYDKLRMWVIPLGITRQGVSPKVLRIKCILCRYSLRKERMINKLKKKLKICVQAA